MMSTARPFFETHNRFLARAVAALTVASSLGLWSAPCRAELPPSPTTEVQVSPEARQQFQVGVSLLQDPDGARYEEAFKSFMQAYEISPSWKILGNLGLSALKIERYGDGIEAYERYLAQAASNIDPAERQQVERDLAVMKATSGKLVLTVTGASGVVVEDTRVRSVGGPVVNTYKVPDDGKLTLTLASGRHTLVAQGEGKRASLELDVKSGSQLQQSLSLEAASPAAAAPAAATADASVPSSTPAPAVEESSSTLRTTGLVVGAVGVAALIGGGVTGILGLSKKSDLESRCPDNRCEYATTDEQSAFQSDKDSLSTLGTLTTAFLIGGGVLTATGATLYIVGGPSESEKVSVSPLLGPGVAALSAQGSF